VKVTIRDVAREAGVSVATVSRVLNDSGPVRDITRRRIREIASRMRYVPDSAARSLITRRSTTLGILLPDLYGEFFSEVIRGIDQAAQRSGYHLLVSGSHNDQGETEAALRVMRGRVDGLIIMSPDIDSAALVANLPASSPVVLLNCVVAGDAFDSLTIDNYGGAHGMVRHLVASGYRRIAFIKGAERNYDAAERLRGYRAALREAALEWTDALEFEGDFTESGGHRAAQLIAARIPRPTAVFAANDSMAIGALAAFRDMGIVVPDDIAVAGFDDVPIARFVTPPLTSVHVSISEMGARAVSMLLHAIEQKNQHVKQQETLPTTLVIRASCGGKSGVQELGERSTYERLASAPGRPRAAHYLQEK
jgi:LacI family transcriptional regulator